MDLDGQIPLLERDRSGAPVAPGSAGGAVLVPGAAVVAGARGDAWLRVDAGEHERRGGAYCDGLVVLDALRRLPVGVPVPVEWLSPRDAEVLAAAPGWALRRSDQHVVRLLRQPVRVQLVVCSGGPWRALLRRASAFRHLAPAAVALERLPPDWPGVAWEADLAGVGVLLDDGTGPVEALGPPVPSAPRKAAHWRFEERAYRAWIRA